MNLYTSLKEAYDNHEFELLPLVRTTRRYGYAFSAKRGPKNIWSQKFAHP